MYPSRNSMGSTKISACGSLPLYSWMRKFGEQVSSWTAAAVRFDVVEEKGFDLGDFHGSDLGLV